MSFGSPKPHNQVQSFLGDAFSVGLQALAIYILSIMAVLGLIGQGIAWVWNNTVVFVYNDPAFHTVLKYVLYIIAGLIILSILSKIFKFVFDHDVKPKYGTIRRYK